MQLGDMKEAVLMLGLIALVAAAVAISLDEFQETQCADSVCGSENATSIAWNISQQGLEGTEGATSFLSTIGVIIGVATLIVIVVGAFQFANR